MALPFLPRDDEFNIKQRCAKLMESWKDLLDQLKKDEDRSHDKSEEVKSPEPFAAGETKPPTSEETEKPKLEEFNVEESKAEEPKLEEAKVEEAKVEEPIADETISDEFKADEPMADEPMAEEVTIKDSEPILATSEERTVGTESKEPASVIESDYVLVSAEDAPLPAVTKPIEEDVPEISDDPPKPLTDVTLAASTNGATDTKPVEPEQNDILESFKASTEADGGFPSMSHNTVSAASDIEMSNA